MKTAFKSWAVQSTPPTPLHKPPLESMVVPKPLTDMPIERLRLAPLRTLTINEKEMLRLICTHCFRLGTAKPMIGRNYANEEVLQSNLLEKMGAGKDNIALFERCWQRMKTSNAILITDGDAASLNQRVRDIADDSIRQAVSWALSEHRKITLGH